MPLKLITDPVTGKVTEVYEFGPGKPAAKPKPEPSLLEKAGKGITDAKSIAETFNPTAMVGQGLKVAGAAAQTLQKTGDLGKAFGAGAKAIVDESNKGTGIAGAIKRVPQRALFTTLQESSDFAQEVGAKIQGKKDPTSAKAPDAPFLGVLPALPRARTSGPAEDLLVGALQLGMGFATGSAAVGLGGMAVKGAFSALPMAARLGVATTRLRAAKGFAEVAAPVVQAGAKISGAVQAGVKAAGPVGKVVQAGAQAVGKSGLSQVKGKAAITSAITDVVAFDQYGGRLTDAADALVKGTPFEPLVIDYLKSDPNDGALEGRFKNSLEGIFVGGGLEIPFRFFKQLKAFKNYKEAVAGKSELDRLKDPKVLEAIDDVKNANDAFQNEVVKQGQTREADPGEQPSFTDELDRPIARNVAEVDPTTLAIAPEVYQYKIAGAKTKTGVSGSLKESKEYNPELAGIISVYRNPKDGKTYVVNGHNRVQKALESGTAKVLVRYIQANSPEGARAIGALQNIAEGQGTAIDAAKFMRDMKAGPEALENYGVNLTGKIASRATPLARLPQNIFDQVSTGALTEDRAIALGSIADLDETVINSVAARAEKGKWSADKITQAMQEAKFATASTPAAGGGMLPGFEDFFATSNFDQLLDVRTEAAKALREGVVALSSAARAGRQGVLEAAGNVIDVAGSQAAKTTAQQAVNLFDRVTQYEGPVRALLNDLAAQVTPKKKAAAIVRENFEKIRAAIDDEANGPRLPFEEPAPRPQPTPIEPEPTAPEPTAPETVPASLSEQLAKEPTAPVETPELIATPVPAAAAKEMPDTRGQGKFFHGAAAEFELQPGGEYGGSGMNIYGNGLYATEDLKIAGQYQKKNSKAEPVISMYGASDELNRAGVKTAEINGLLGRGRAPIPSFERMQEIASELRQQAGEYPRSNTTERMLALADTLDNYKPVDVVGQRVIYEINEKKPIKFYDLDAPVDNKVLQELERIASRSDLVADSLDILDPSTYSSGATPSISLGQIMDEIRNTSSSLRVPFYEVQDIFEELIDTLKADGYGGFTHEGGRLAGGGKRLHQVRIYWDPAENINTQKVDLAEQLVDRVLDAVAAPKTKGAKSKEKPSFPTDEVRLAAAEKAGNTSLAEQLRARIAKTAVQPMGNVAAAAIEPPSPLAAEIKAATRKFDPDAGGRIEGAARAYQKYFNQGKRQADEITEQQALDAVRAANVSFDPDRVKSLDMDKVRNDISMGRFTPEVKAAQDAYRSIYDPSFKPLRSRGPELPELPKKPGLTQEEIQARIEDIDKLIADLESGKLNMQVDEPATRALVKELTKDIRTVAGDEVAIRFNNAFIETKGGDVAWGYKPGETMKVGGEYDPIKDIIEVNGVELISADVQRPELLRLLLDNLEKTGFHEAFHRVQFNFLKPEEIKVFNQYLAEIKLDFGSMADREANALAGRPDLLPIEKAAVAFQIYAWARKNNLDPRKALLGYTREELGKKGIVSALESAALAVMDTLYDFVERVGNAFNDRGFISIKSIFEDAYSGKLAKRGELGSVVDEAGKAVPSELDRLDLLQAQAMEYGETRRGQLNLPPLKSNADNFVNEYEKVKAKIASGEMTLDDLITNVVADRNVQPMQSPSGETAYVPDPEAAAGASASMRAWMNVGGTRDEVSGLPTIPDEIVKRETERWLTANDYQAKAILGELEYRASSLVNAAALQRSLMGAMELADYTNNKAAIIADRWLNSSSDPNVDRNALRQELLAIYKHASDINTPVVKVTRALGQVLRTGQIQRPQPGSIDFKNTLEEYKLDEILVNGAKEEEAVSLPDYLGEKIDPQFVEAINNNEFTPELDAMIDQIAYNLKATRDTPGFAPGFWSRMNKVSKIGLNGLVMYRSAQLLSSGLTFWGNTWNGVLRLIQLPLSQALGAILSGSPERANMSLMIYGQYVSNLKNAFSLAKESYKAGRTLYDMDNNSLDFLDQQAAKDAQLEQGADPALLPTTDKGFTLSTLPWVEIQDKSNWAIAQKRLWQLTTSPIRAQVAVDTLFKVLAGQSFEFVRNLPMGLDSAVAQGLDRNSKEAMDWAQQYAKSKVDQVTQHVTVDGRTILDAVMDSPHAQTAMRWATFTDDIDAQMEVRTLDRGRELAADKKLEGEAAESWAKEWADKKVEMPWFYKGPSFVPMVWQHLINMSPLFSIIQPFNRTPGDIIKSTMRMTPGANFLVDTFQRDINSMDAFTRDRAVGDVAVGASAMVLASIAMTTGIVEFTGGGPQEPGAKQKWRDMGNQAYSYRIGDGEWTSMRAFEPFATMFGAIADYNEIANKVTKEQREQLGSALTLYIMGEVYKGNLSKTYYQGFTEFYEAVSGNTGLGIAPNSRDSWNRYISRIVASLQPASAALRAGRRISDRAVRQIEPSNIFQETFDEIRNQTPGWSKDIPARVNWLTGDMIIQSRIMGDEYLPADSPWMGMVMQYMPWSPFQKGEEKRLLDPVALEMSRLHGLGAQFRGPSPTDYGAQLRLGPRDFAEYNRVMATVTNPVTNTTLYQELDATIKSDYYQSLPPQEISSTDLSDRALLIDGIITKYKEIAKETYLGQRPDLEYQLLRKEAKDNTVKYRLKYGLTPQQFTEALR